jgi:hypothetical protein
MIAARSQIDPAGSMSRSEMYGRDLPAWDGEALPQFTIVGIKSSSSNKETKGCLTP